MAPFLAAQISIQLEIENLALQISKCSTPSSASTYSIGFKSTIQ